MKDLSPFFKGVRYALVVLDLKELLKRQKGN